MTITLFFSECKKGADDPLFSLRTRKARMTGNWTMTEGYKITTTFWGQESKMLYKDQSYESVYNGKVYEVGPAKFTMNLGKDGKLDMVKMLEPYASEGRYLGSWNFTGGIGDVKKKEQLLLRDTLRMYNNDVVYDIKELRNKRLVIRRKMSDPGGSSVEEEYVFVQ